MNFIAILMFISLIMIIITSLDPRITSSRERRNSFIRILSGTVLGVMIMFLYGLGVPGFKYFFMIVGIGGVAHMFAPRKEIQETEQVTKTLPVAYSR